MATYGIMRTLQKVIDETNKSQFVFVEFSLN